MAYKSKAMQNWAGENQPSSVENKEYKSSAMRNYEANMAKKAQQEEEARQQELIAQQEAEAPRRANLKDLTLGSIGRGYATSKYGNERYDEIMLGTQRQAKQAQKAKEKTEQEKYNFAAQSGLGKTISGAGELIGQQIYNLTNRDTLASVGANVAGAAAVGAAVPLPEEVVTMPTAVARGLKLGSAATMYQISAAQAYDEMVESGVSEATAKKVANVIGAGMGALEGIQADKLAKSVNLLKGVKGEASQKAATRLAEALSKKQVAKAAGKIAGATAFQTAQEVAQEGVNIAGQNIARKNANVDTISGEEAGQRLKDTAIQSALSFGLLEGAGAVGGAMMNRNNIKAQGNEANAAENDADSATNIRKKDAAEQTEEKPLALPQYATKPTLYADKDGLKTSLNERETEIFTEAFPDNREIENSEMVNKVLYAANKANKDPVAVAESNFKAAEADIQPYLEQTIAEYEAFIGEGVAVNSETNQRMSNNPQWYRDYYAKHKKAPSKADKKAIGEKMFWEDVAKGGGNYVPPEIAQRYNAFKGVAEQLKGLPLDTMYVGDNTAITSREGLKPVYSPTQSKQVVVDTRKFAVEKRYGQQGKDSLTRLNNATESRLAEFDRYYRAGTANQQRPADSNILSKNEATAAFMAGMADAKTNKEAYANKKVAINKKAGLDMSSATHLTLRERITWDRFAKALGVRISFVDTLGDKNAKYNMATGEIVISRKADNFDTVVVHEIVHRLRQTAPEEFYELSKSVLELLESQGKLEGAMSKYSDLYGLNEGSIEYFDTMEEIVADFMANEVSTEDLINMVNAKPSVAEKMLKIIEDVIKNLAGLNDAELKQTKAKLQDLHDKMKKAVNASENAVKQGVAKDGKISGERHSYIGSNAMAIDREVMKKARSMAGDNETIRQATGWFKGADGKWRFEIDDSEAVASANGLAGLNDADRNKFKNIVAGEKYKKYANLMEKMFFGDFEESKNILKEIQSIQEKNPDIKEAYKAQNRTIGSLQEFLKHNELYKQYPEIKNMDVVFDIDVSSSVKGGYDGRFAIHLNKNLKENEDALKSVLLHEIQHFIQQREGFSNGATPDYWVENLEAGNKQVKLNLYEKYQAEKDAFLSKVVYKSPDYKNLVNQLEKYKKGTAEYDNLLNAIGNKLYEDFDESKADVLANQLIDWAEAMNVYKNYDDSGRMTAMDLYRSTAGEQESRDVEQRMNYTAQQRKEKIPFIKDETTVFVEDERYSRKTDAEYLELAQNPEANEAQLQKMVGEYAKKAMPDSKIVDKKGNLKYVYHGTDDMFYEFNPLVKGGVNGVAEGFGIYTSDSTDVTSHYGDRQIKMYANITRPASSSRKTITTKELIALIKDTCEKEATRMVEEDGYDSVNDALRDTWVSNSTYTYDKPMSQVYREVANDILRMNSSDMAVIQEVMFMMAIRDYGSAIRFYNDSLIPVTGFDGIVTQWDNATTGDKSNIILAFNSNQLKLADPVTYDDNGDIIPLSKRFNEDNKDIRYSYALDEKERAEYNKKWKYNEEDYNLRGWAVVNEGLLPVRLYRAYLKAIKNIKLGDKRLINDTTTGEYLIQLGKDWVVYSDGDFADATIKALYKFYNSKEKDIFWRLLKNARKHGIELDKEIVEYYRRHGFATRYRAEDFAKNYGIWYSKRNGNGAKGSQNSNFQQNGSGNFGKNISSVGYKTENIEDYYNDKTGKYEFTAENGKTYTFTKLKDGYQLDGADYYNKSIKALIENTNRDGGIRNIVKYPEYRYSKKSEPIIPDGYKERGFNESVHTKSDYDAIVQQEFIDNPEIYKQLANKVTKEKAKAIMDKGLAFAETEFPKLLERMDATAIALGDLMAREYSNMGEYDKAVTVIRDMAKQLTKAGQFSQAAVIALTKSNPMTALAYAKRDIDKLNADGHKTFGKKWKDFELTADEEEMFKNIKQGDADAIKAAYEKINKRIAKEYPSTIWQKFIEASRISMLLNPRTNAKNIASNMLLRPITRTSGIVSAGIQKAYKYFNNDYTPTQAVTVRKETKKLAEDIWNNIKDTLETTNKYNEGIKANKRDIVVFKEGVGTRVMENIAPGTLHKLNQLMDTEDAGLMETLRHATYWFLEMGDNRYVRKNFLDRLGSYLEAQGIREITEANQETIDTAVQVAYREAMRATFKDDTALSKWMASIKHTGNPYIDAMMEMIMPFTKTPANIAMRGIDYSPIGLLNTLNKYSKNKDFDELADELGKNLLGSALIAFGALLFGRGLVTGGEPENEKEAAFLKQQGWLPYAVKVGDSYTTYDWAQPAAIPIIMGVTIMESLEEGRLGVVDAVKNAGVASFNQWVELSPLQSLKEVMGGYGTVGENLLNTAIEMPQRLIPSALGATARTADTTQRLTYSKGNVAQTQKDLAKSKVPGLSQTLPAAYDTWGNVKKRDNNTGVAAINQFINPASYKRSNATEVDREIERLYKELGDSAVYPRKASYSIEKGGKTYTLSNAEYSEYQRIMGELSYDGVKALMAKPSYSSLSDAEKLEIIKDIYDNAFEKAKYTIMEGQGYKKTEEDIRTAKETKIKQAYLEATPENIAEYYIAYYILNNADSDKTANGTTIAGSKKKNGINRLMELGFTRSEARRLYDRLKG